MKSKSKRSSGNGLKVLLGAIVAVFAVVAIAVGVKYLTGSLASTDGKKVSDKSNKEEENAVKVEGIELSIDRPTVRAGEETQLNVKVTPENATNTKLKWTVSGGGGTVSDEGIFVPAAEAGKSTVDVTASAADGSGVSASLSVRVLEAIDPQLPMLAVTYDDGPNSETTPIVLDALEKNYGVATFFMQGVNIAGNEELLKRSYEMGNEMANHSWNHPQLTTLSAEEIEQQISDTDKLIFDACGQGVGNPILRPPYGSINDTVKAAAGKPIIMWSLDTLDWKTRDTQQTIDSCLTAKDGDIILMHDIHQSTVDGAEQIITGLQESGFQLVTVSELYRYRKGDFSDGTVHYSMTAEEMNANEAAASSEQTGETENEQEAEGQQSTDAAVEGGDSENIDDGGEDESQEEMDAAVEGQSADDGAGAGSEDGSDDTQEEDPFSDEEEDEMKDGF